jgi:signal transduction histidine kinase
MARKKPVPLRARIDALEKRVAREVAKRKRAENARADSAARETATSEILRVISSSPTDAQPVFDAIVARAKRLLGAYTAMAFRRIGDEIHLAAYTRLGGNADVEVVSDFPRPLADAGAMRVWIAAEVLHIPDVDSSDVDPRTRRAAHMRGFRSVLLVPMRRGADVIGTLGVSRREPGPFSEAEIALLQTFADQAVIAIENVRLFTELEVRNRDLTELLDRQMATSEILRVISGSGTDVQPVFDAIADSALRLLRGWGAMVLRFDGELLHLAAICGGVPGSDQPLRERLPRPVGRAEFSGAAILDREGKQIADIEAEESWAELRANARVRGWRAALAVPMLQDGRPIGAINVTRAEPGAFSEQEVELLKTFADQAVIAVENARLLTELETRNRDLIESLERQTATAEILRAISQSQTDVQPVFEAIAQNAKRLFHALGAFVFRFDGELLHEGASAGGVDTGRRYFPMRPSPELTVGRCVLARTIIHIADVRSDPEASPASREIGRVQGWRSALAVPMMRDAELIGVIMVTRTEAGAFEPAGIELLKTFSDQAVIAVENARLLSELQARTQDLTRSVDKLTALGEVGQAVSSSLELETVLSTIVARAVQLAGAHAGTIWEYDEAAEEFRLRITQNVDDSGLLARRDAKVKKGEGAVGRLAITHEPVQIPDITAEGAYEGRLREALVGAGTRALLAVPLLREGRVLGGLVMSRRTPGEFPPEVVDVLKTFATQSALAIQNARLFREIEEKGRQLEAASRHKSEFLANMSHELRTPLNAIIGFSEVLGERMFGDINEKQEEYVQDILGSGRHLLSLINDILDLSKIEAGRMELESAEFDLPSSIENALTLVRERAGRRGIALEHVIDERLGAIHGDERKVKQVLLNLLSNALKFTPEGGRIDVHAAVMDGTAEISVTDTGVGIAPEDRDAVFEEFRQVGAADKKVEGTGLGLPLARKFVELHGGRLWFQSQVGMGSTFTFSLPLTGR